MGHGVNLPVQLLDVEVKRAEFPQRIAGADHTPMFGEQRDLRARRIGVVVGVIQRTGADAPRPIGQPIKLSRDGRCCLRQYRIGWVKSDSSVFEVENLADARVQPFLSRLVVEEACGHAG